MQLLQRPLAALALACALGACSKDEPTPPKDAQPATVPTEAPKAAATEEHPASAPAAAKSEEPAAPAAENTAPAKAGEVAEGESAKTEEAAKTEEKPAAKTDEKAAEGSEAAAADAKKPSSKKKKDEKAAETAAKETKPKFTELGVQVTKTGSGTAATTGRIVTLHYKASVADAEKPFDSTFASNRPLSIDLSPTAKLQVIEGLRRGLEGLMPGSEARLQIPAELAWGEKGNPAVGVPANADVVFEVQVLDVQ